MSNRIERLRYYDEEFLRAFDFTAEQNYHIEMRRRLNRSLHLAGIVEGLQLEVNEDNGVKIASITPGMAIDSFGREIYLFTPYTFGDVDIAQNRISGSGDPYDVWIRYRKTPATPPSAGYGICNQPDQYTRWVEGSTVVLLPKGTVPFTDPQFIDPDPDDPSTDQVGVLLGTISVDPGNALAPFDGAVFDSRRVFMGLRAQRIRPPLDATLDPNAPYNFLGQGDPVSPSVSLGVEADLYAQRNVVIGDNFDVGAPTAFLPPISGAYPMTGTLKVADNIFVNGDIYWNVNSQRLGFSEKVKLFVPEIIADTTPVVVTQTPVAGKVQAVTAKTLTAKTLSAVNRATAFAYISGFRFNSRQKLDTLVAPGESVEIQITSVSEAHAGKDCIVTVNWTVGPVGAGPVPAITDFGLTFVAICFP